MACIGWNSSGKFNVPHGRYNKPDIVGSDNLRAVSKALKGVEISVGSYESNLDVVDIDPERTFVYFDPLTDLYLILRLSKIIIRLHLVMQNRICFPKNSKNYTIKMQN